MKRARAIRTRSVTCTDPFGREVSVTVAVDRTGKVFLTAPPGETGRFEPGEVVELVAALNAALGTARAMHTVLEAS